MSGSISESEACGNDWDETWKPPSAPGACATPNKFTFLWNCPWKKVETVLVNPDGHREIVSDEAGCFQPIKLQFLLTNCIERLKTLIYELPTMDVKCLMTGTGLLEITLKSDVHPGITTEVAAVLSNEIEDIFLKMIPRLPFTCKIAEDLFITYIQDGKLTMVRDDSKVYIVGPSTSKTLISSTIDQFNSLITTESVSFVEKWKRVVLSKVKAVSSLSDKFKDVSITANDDARKVLFQGRKADVKEAVRELDAIISNLYVEKISIDLLVLQLLLCEEASSLLGSIMDKHQFDVSWTVEDNYLFVVSKEKVSTSNIKQLVSENFINVGFSSLSSTSDPFTESKVFTDTIRANENTFLVVETGASGCNVASTKTISRILLQQEHAYYEMAAKSVQVNDTDKEVTELTRINSQLKASLQSLKEENITAYKEAERQNMKLQFLAQENKDTNSKIEILTSERRDLQNKIRLQRKDRRNNSSVDESLENRRTTGEDSQPKSEKIHKKSMEVMDVTNLFEEDIGRVKSLNNTEIVYPDGISEKMYRNIEVSSSDNIFYYLSHDRKLLIIFTEDYALLEEAKHKAEIILGLKQAAKGRRNRVFASESDFSSSRIHPKSLSEDHSLRSSDRSSKTMSSASRPLLEMTYKTIEGLLVKVYNGNILSLNVDCIVSASNENMNHGGGVAYVIASAAGYDFNRESNDYIRQNGPIAVGECCTTSAGKLHYKHVIHTVGPKWYDYSDKKICAGLLKKAVEATFFEADSDGMSSIAVPSISSGIFGVPKEVCCTEYANAVNDYSRNHGHNTSLKEIHFIDKDMGMITMIQKEFAQRFGYPDDEY